MPNRLGTPARLIWSLARSGLGTTLAGDGSSGDWPDLTSPFPPTQLNNATPVDLRDVEDLWLTAMAADITGTTPSLTVTLNQFDASGNVWPLASLAAITGSGVSGGKQISLGKHGGSAGNYFVFSAWGQVAWAITGADPVFTGVDIELWAR
ncbi:MAG TPA: hypothetical protein VFQ44_01935 [Streptosporangiaceae bacterium]|nr:hypothetical protein [Streptosporangiaceae bacterium]